MGIRVALQLGIVVAAVVLALWARGPRAANERRVKGNLRTLAP